MGSRKGCKNKHTFQVEEIAHKFRVEPFEIMMRIASGDWEFFDFPSPTKMTFTPQGIEIEELNIPMELRGKMAEKACRYLYSQKQAVEVTAPEGIEIIVRDYMAKKCV